MILITGATGNLGSKIIETMLVRIPADRIAALVRDEHKAAHLKEKGVNIRLGDYDDPEALDKAMIGVEKVLLVSGGRAVNGLEQHQNVVDAAKKAGVKCIAYTSRCLTDRTTVANDLMKRHFDTEDYIMASGLNYILFRNILYMDTLTIFLGKNVLATGIYLPAGEGEVSYVLRSDQAEAIGHVLASDDCNSRVYQFTNSQTYSFYDVAKALSQLSGKEIFYTPVDPGTFQNKAKELGMADFAVGMAIAFMTDIKNGQEATVSDDLEKILGRKPATLTEGLKLLFNL
ncbi:MAG: NAD(P)-dependent oxidoreductase [Cytophaga sp.]|nr:NAD(P)-dependent oxidoreductase [Cytophaga sp.]